MREARCTRCGEAGVEVHQCPAGAGDEIERLRAENERLERVADAEFQQAHAKAAVAFGSVADLQKIEQLTTELDLMQTTAEHLERQVVKAQLQIDSLRGLMYDELKQHADGPKMNGSYLWYGNVRVSPEFVLAALGIKQEGSDD